MLRRVGLGGSWVAITVVRRKIELHVVRDLHGRRLPGVGRAEKREELAEAKRAEEERERPHLRLRRWCR